MPRIKRKKEEIDEIREEILHEALNIIITEGYKGFNLRKLGKRLGIAAKTIYNYFHNKDEIYLLILTRGFEKLHTKFARSLRGKKTPLDRITAIIYAFVDFGFENPHLYNLMYTWNMPKYNDYVGTKMEAVATVELKTALVIVEQVTDVLKEFGTAEKPISDEEALFHFIYIWCQGHGYLAGCLNGLLDYVYKDPQQLKERLIQRTIANLVSNITTA